MKALDDGIVPKEGFDATRVSVLDFKDGRRDPGSEDLMVLLADTCKAEKFELRELLWSEGDESMVDEVLGVAEIAVFEVGAIEIELEVEDGSTLEGRVKALEDDMDDRPELDDCVDDLEMFAEVFVLQSWCSAYANAMGSRHTRYCQKTLQF